MGRQRLAVDQGLVFGAPSARPHAPVLRAAQPSRRRRGAQLRSCRIRPARRAQGHQGRLVSVRAQLLPALPSGGALSAGDGHHHQPHRLPLNAAHHLTTRTLPNGMFARRGRGGAWVASPTVAVAGRCMAVVGLSPRLLAVASSSSAKSKSHCAATSPVRERACRRVRDAAALNSAGDAVPTCFKRGEALSPSTPALGARAFPYGTTSSVDPKVLC
jgi:hypothetical protein